MTKKPTSHDGPSPDDGRNNATDRIDADPPHPAEFDARVEQFRKLLAELIAKQMRSQQQDSKNARDKGRD